MTPNPGNVCYDSVNNLRSSSLFYKYINIKIYRTVIFPALLYGCETWSVTLREKRKLRVFGNKLLRIFGPKGNEVCLIVFLALQPIVVVFSQPGSGL
jgi:hypothetical protein